MAPTPRAIVVGGGLAGLVAARHLAAGGIDVTLLERGETVGGRVRTLERDGYRFDRGFQVLFTAYPAVQRELDLEALDLRRFAPGATIARPNHRSTLADPLRQPRAAPATLFNPDISLGDKLRVAKLLWELRGTDPDAVFGSRGDEDDVEDVSIERYLRDRGFSDRFLEHFVAPFYGGITLDRSLSTSSRVFEYTFRTLAAGSIAVPAAGMGAIPAQLADRARTAGATLETGVSVESITRDSNGRHGGSTVTVSSDDDTYEADAVVVATDPTTARTLTAIDGIPTDGRACVTQYYRLPGEGDIGSDRRLLLNAGDEGPNHVVPHSAVAPEYAPDGETLLSATYLGDREESDAELEALTRHTLASWFPERRVDDLERLHTGRIEFAQFDQPPGIHERLPDARDPAGPVYLAGDYTRWSSIQGAMESGREAAGAVLEELSE